MNRISAVEIEIHKEHGLYDVILGAIIDFGEAGGKFGGDVKPLTDRIREIASIARKNTKEYEQLPSPDDIGKLPAPEKDE